MTHSSAPIFNNDANLEVKLEDKLMFVLSAIQEDKEELTWERDLVYSILHSDEVENLNESMEETARDIISLLYEMQFSHDSFSSFAKEKAKTSVKDMLNSWRKQ